MVDRARLRRIALDGQGLTDIHGGDERFTEYLIDLQEIIFSLADRLETTLLAGSTPGFPLSRGVVYDGSDLRRIVMEAGTDFFVITNTGQPEGRWECLSSIIPASDRTAISQFRRVV